MTLMRKICLWIRKLQVPFEFKLLLLLVGLALAGQIGVWIYNLVRVVEGGSH